jgi:hypothetical protein
VAASPRNHLDLQRLLLRGEGRCVTGFGQRQDPSQITTQLDLKLALGRREDDGVD